MKAIDQNEKCFGWKEKQKNYNTKAKEDKYFSYSFRVKDTTRKNVDVVVVVVVVVVVAQWVSGIWTSLTWLWWFGFRPEPIFCHADSNILLASKSGQ